VEFPQTLLPEHRKLLKNSLPETNFMDDDYDCEKVEEAKLENVDMDIDFTKTRDDHSSEEQQQSCRTQ